MIQKENLPGTQDNWPDDNESDNQTTSGSEDNNDSSALYRDLNLEEKQAIEDQLASDKKTAAVDKILNEAEVEDNKQFYHTSSYMLALQRSFNPLTDKNITARSIKHEHEFYKNTEHVEYVEADNRWKLSFLLVRNMQEKIREFSEKTSELLFHSMQSPANSARAFTSEQVYKSPELVAREQIARHATYISAPNINQVTIEHIENIDKNIGLTK